MMRANALEQAGKLRPVHRPSAIIINLVGLRRQLSNAHVPLPSPFTSDKGLVPILCMEKIEQLERFFPAGAPVVRLMQAPFEPPENEAVHLDHANDHHASNVEARFLFAPPL